MIKNLIYILLLLMSMIYCVEVPCKDGRIEGGVCVCNSGATGADCSLRKCPIGESFSISSEKVTGGGSRELESIEDKWFDSMMELKVSEKRLLAIKGITVSAIISNGGITIGGAQYDKVKFEGDLGFDKTGGIIKCKKSDDGSEITKIVYGKSKDENTYYVENGLTSGYECFVISKSNDFSLFFKNAKIALVKFEKKDNLYSTSIEISKLGEVFDDIGIPLSGNIAFNTSTDNDNKIYTGTYTSVIEPPIQPRLLNDNSSRILAGETLKLTITTSQQIETGSAIKITPYLLMNGKGERLSVENSEIGNYVNNLGKDGLKLTKVEAVTNSLNDKIYEVSDVVYEGIGKNGGKLSCVDIYGNKFNGIIYSYKSDTGIYFTEFANDKYIKDDKSLFSCEITSFENDLSLLLRKITPVRCSGNPSTYTCTISGLRTLFTTMGITTSITDEKNIVFKKSDNTIYTGTFTTNGNDLELTIKSEETITGTITPYLLMNANGDKLSLENSEIGYYVNKIGGDTKLTKVEAVTPNGLNDKLIKVSDVKYEGIGKNGGKLSCNDIFGNKFNGNIYSYKEDSTTYFIEYDNEDSITTKLFSCEITSTENDLSLLLRKVQSETCSDPNKCTIAGLATLFTDMGIDTPITDAKNIAFRITDPENDNKIYTGTFTATAVNARLLNDNSSRILADEKPNLELTITSAVEITASDTITPYLLMKADGSSLSIQSSELYENVYCDNKNECILIKDEGGDSGSNSVGNSITIKDGKMIFSLNDVGVNSKSFDVVVYKEAKILFHKYFREGLSLMNKNGNSVKIIEINIKPPPSSRRLLFENKRNLDTPDSENYEIVTYPPINTIVTSSGEDIISSYSIYHREIECSGQGNCNRVSGECECYEGYSGSNCNKMNCFNNCDGNGECKLVKDILNINKKEDYIPFGYSDSIYGCNCGNGYRGNDCSLVECPSDKDPDGGTNTGDLEYRDCSGRGICDYNVGVCSCFYGYGGKKGSCNEKSKYL